MGLQKGPRGQVGGRHSEFGKEEGHGFVFLALRFSGLLCFVYDYKPRCPMEKLPNPTGAAFLGACVRVCCEEEGDLSGSESCSKPVGGKIAIVVSGPTWL